MSFLNTDLIRARLKHNRNQLVVVRTVLQRFQHHLMTKDRTDLFQAELITQKQMDSGIRLDENELEDAEVELYRRIELLEKLLRQPSTLSKDELSCLSINLLIRPKGS